MSIVTKLFPEIADVASGAAAKLFDKPSTTDQKLVNLALDNVAKAEDFTINSGKTQRANTTNTYTKAFDLLGINEGETVVDAGAGLGLGSLSAKERGANLITVEPNPQKGFEPDFNYLDDVPDNVADKLVNMNVLNVVEKDVRDNLVQQIGRVLKENGSGIINTRSAAEVNAAKNKIKSGDGWIIGTGKERTFQKGFTPKELQEYVKQILGQGFAVEPVKNLSGSSVKITKLPMQYEDINASTLPQPLEGL